MHNYIPSNNKAWGAQRSNCLCKHHRSRLSKIMDSSTKWKLKMGAVEIKTLTSWTFWKVYSFMSKSSKLANHPETVMEITYTIIFSGWENDTGSLSMRSWVLRDRISSCKKFKSIWLVGNSIQRPEMRFWIKIWCLIPLTKWVMPNSGLENIQPCSHQKETKAGLIKPLWLRPKKTIPITPCSQTVSALFHHSHLHHTVEMRAQSISSLKSNVNRLNS